MENGIQIHGLDLSGVDLIGISFRMEGRIVREYQGACSYPCQSMSEEIQVFHWVERPLNPLLSLI